MSDNPKLYMHHIQRELCQRSFYYFVQYFWDTIIAEKPIWNWHIEYICNELQIIGTRVAMRLPKEYDYYIFNVPPGSSKSTIISEMYPLWCWTNDPTQRFICASYASTPAEDISEKCYNIYKSEKFALLFPELVAKSTGGKTGFKNGLLGERYTTSTGSAITGIHAHQILIDDGMTPSIATSLVERESANKWVSETLSSRKVDHDITVTIIVMQRLHEMDTTGYILSKKGLRVHHICIPAELTQDIKPAYIASFYIDGLFDPIRKSRANLDTAKIELGSYGYSGQMLQNPAPIGGGMIKKNWFEIVPKAAIPYNQVINFQIDTAYTKKETNDPTGILGYYLQQGCIYVTCATNVYKEFPDLCYWLPLFTGENGYDYRSMIRVEPKASGKSLVQQLKVTTGLNIIESEAPDKDKISTVNECSPKMESGKIKLVDGVWVEEFLQQLTSFPKGQHDEYVDCLNAIIKRELIKSVNVGKYSFA